MGLVTDLYELTMSSSYLRRGMTAPATFSLFARRLPPDRGFLVAAGLDDVLSALEDFAFDDTDLEWLAGMDFDPDTLDALGQLRFTGDVWAIPEGRVFFANEPLIEVTAPLPEAQLVETLVLNQLTYQSALATKAARCTVAANGRADLVDFSLRRTHGIEAGMSAARAAAIAGFAGTSNVEAARRLGIPAVGTMAHSYVEAFPDERGAFVAYAEDFPNRTTFLVDTYDTLTGIKTAIEVADELDLQSGLGIRLDSGDLLDLSKQARRLLDDAGRHDVAIVASGGCDEFVVRQLLDDGAPIDVFGVGTSVGISADAPTLDTAYKLVEYDGRPVMKLSTGKETRPGPKQVYRSDLSSSDLLATRTEPAPHGHTPLLAEVMRAGRRTAPAEPLTAARERLHDDLALLPAALSELRSPSPPTARVSDRLESLTIEVSQQHSATAPPPAG
jgi:nicotinate phosphoribosyltransferase